MDKLNNILNALEEVDTNTLFQSAVKKFDDDIIKLNHSQLEQGQKSNGESTPEHTFGSLSKKYVDEKVAKGLIDNSTLPNVNLKNTGSFYSGFKIKLQPDAFNIFSTDSKSSELQDYAGSEIFGINKDNLEVLRQKTSPFIQKEFKKLIL